jgi:glycosyltransferase involved in cell wall biosynthesis
VDKAIIKPISAVIPTANRADVLRATLISLSNQNVQPAEIIVIDASDNDDTEKVCAAQFAKLESNITYFKAVKKGAATQRNQGMDIAKHEFILFCDDDILLEPFCIERLWNGINSEENIGGVNAMVINQRYHTPGKLTRTMYQIMYGEKLSTYAGKCIGPAWNLLPEDDDNLPGLVPVDWLNTTCTLYRRKALPDPVFPEVFTGYSLMEDLTLSLIVARNYKLYNARTARIFHDSQPGTHKNNTFNQARMELLNRHYVMKYVMGRNTFNSYLKLTLLQLFGILALLSNAQGWKNLFPAIGGKLAAIGDISKGKMSK